MNGIYSKFYTGNESPFGIGTWDSNQHRKLKHSSSQPYFLTNNSSKKNNLILPPVNNNYNERERKNKLYTTHSSSSSSSFQYDINKNRKELSNYIKDINYSVANKLQNDNFIAQQKLNNLKNNYNEIKNLLNNKLEKLEQNQQMQFDNLKLALGQGGGLKMLGAVKNANGGNIYDLQRAEQEDIIDATRKLPKLLDKKLNDALNYKRYNKYKNNYDDNLSNMKRRMDEELNRQKFLDDMKFKRELDEIEAKRETMRQERERMLQELQNQDIDDLNDPLYLPPPPPFPPSMYNPYNPYNPYMVPPPYFMPPMNNNNHSDTSELIKFFLIKKLFDNDNRPNTPGTQNLPYPYGYNNNYMPFQPFGYPNPYQRKSSSQNIYPQPIILQSPFMNPNGYNPNQIPNGMQRKGTKKTTESQKGVPFVDPLEKYLEMVNAVNQTSKGSNKKGNAKPIKLKSKEGEEENEEGDGEENNEDDGERDDEGGNEEGEGDGEGEGDEGDGEDDE